jgi:hypothetical protein
MSFAFRGLVKRQKIYRQGALSEEISKWQQNTDRHINGKIGYIDGIINHKWHGSI